MNKPKGTVHKLPGERRRAEEQLRVLTRARKVMADCRRVLVRATDESRLLEDMCRIAVESGGYRAAWIGLVRHDEDKTIQPVASAGDHDGYLTSIRISWADNEFGRGPSGTAVRTGKPQVARHIRDDPHFSKLRKEALALGFQAVAAFPLTFEKEMLGVIGLLSAESDAFDSREVELLDGLANDIAYGLANLRLRLAQRRDDQLLRLEHTIARRLAEADSVSAGLQAVIRAICELEQWDSGRYFGLDDKAGVLRFSDAWGMPGSAIDQLIERSCDVTYAPGVGLAGTVLQSGQPFWAPDIGAAPRAKKHALALGMRGAFLFPVTSRAQTIGVVVFNSREVRQPDDRLLSAVSVIGSQVGQFLKRKQAEEVLRESEARFRSLTELSSDWYWEQDAQFRFTRFAGRTIGTGSAANPELAIGKTRWEAAAELLEGNWEDHRRLLEAHQPFYDLEFRVVAPSGQEYFISSSGQPFFDANGVFQGYRGNGRDITARVREDRLLRLEHSVARSLAEADSASAGLKAVIRAVCETEGWDCGRYWRVDEQAGVLRFHESWNKPDPMIERFIAGKRDAVFASGVGLAGRTWQTGQPTWVSNIKNDAHALRAALTLETGMQGAFHFPVISEGKILGVLAFNSREIREPDERLLQAVGIIGSQIGQFLQRKQAEEVLRESEARFRSLTQVSSDWYWEQDAEYRFVDMTSEIDRMTGVSALAHIGKRRWELAAPNMSEADWAAHRAVVEAHQPFHDLELSRLAEDGNERWVSISGEPIFDAEGRFKGYRGIGKDITARKREERLLKLEHAVTRSLAAADSASAGLKAVIQTLCETESWPCGRYFHADEEAGVLRFGEAWGAADAAVERFIENSREVVYRRGQGLSGRVWESGEPLWSSDASKDGRSSGTSRRSAGVQGGALVFPVISDGKTIGVLSLSGHEAREPDARLLQAIHVIGSQIGQFFQRKQGEEALRRFRLAMDNSADMIVLIDRATMRFVDVNSTVCQLLGYSREELRKMGPQDLLPASREELERAYDELIADPSIKSGMTSHYRCKDGSLIPFESKRQVLRSGDTYVIAVVSHDLRERIAAEERLRNQALQQRLIAEFGQQALASADLQGVLSRAAELVHDTLKADYSNMLELEPDGRSLHYKAAVGWPAEWVGSRVVPIEAGSRLQYILSHGEALIIKDYDAESEFVPPTPLLAYGVRSGVQVPIFGTRGAFGVLSVHTRQPRSFAEDELSFLRSVANILAIAIERKNAEDKLAHLAQFDTITSLPNRYLFRDRLGQTLTQAQRNHWLIGVLFVDLDRFKAVNDTYGHGAGDKLLREVAGRLKDCVRSGDTVGRLSGDEFAVMLSNLAKADDASLVAQKVINALAAPFDLDGHQTSITASIGIAVYPADGAEPDALLKNADTAMYRAKQQGRNGYQFYLPEMNERLMQRLKFETHLRGALERSEFLLNYQPKVSLESGAITGFEALLRWRHGDLMVSPAEFIPILEETGLIVPVGEWVLRSACEQLKQWEREGLAVRPVAVNLSARQFQRKNLAEVVAQTLRETGVDPQLLELELTESLLMSDAEEAVQTLRELKALGVRLAVDDFGTGYSSLAYLRRFPLDTLKIDRAFIRDAVSNPDDATLAITIISLAHGLKLKVVAEGVETEAQLDLLRLHGCDEMQGFYFSRPLPLQDCTRALAEDRRLQNMPERAAPSQPMVLLVDDNPVDRMFLEGVLAREGFRVLTASGPNAALEMLARDGASIVISDYEMPEMTGVEFLSNVRKLFPDTVRIVVSAHDDWRTLIEAINNAGIHKFLSKNWDPDRLRAEVREAYERR